MQQHGDVADHVQTGRTNCVTTVRLKIQVIGLAYSTSVFLRVRPICFIIPFLSKMRRWTRCGLMFITFFSASRYSLLSLLTLPWYYYVYPGCQIQHCAARACVSVCVCVWSKEHDMIRVTGMYTHIQGFASNKNQ